MSTVQGIQSLGSFQEELRVRFDVVVLHLTASIQRDSNLIRVFDEWRSGCQILSVAVKEILKISCNPRDYGRHPGVNAVAVSNEKAVQMVGILVCQSRGEKMARGIGELSVSTELTGGGIVL